MTIRPLEIRKKLGRDRVSAPTEWGPAGWRFFPATPGGLMVIVSENEWPDGVWIHASVTTGDVMPDYETLQLVHRAVFGDGYAYQVFAPPEQHVSIHETCLHLWGREDGASVTPEFGQFGTI